MGPLPTMLGRGKREYIWFRMQRLFQNCGSWAEKEYGAIPESAGLPDLGVVIIYFQMLGFCKWLSERF